MKKRFLPCLLALTLLFPLPCRGAEDSTDFTDVHPGDWFTPYIQVCTEKGLLQGVGDGRFNPHGVVNNDEAMVMVARVLWQANGGQGPLPQGPSPEEMVAQMGDDAGYWFQYGVDTARELAQMWPWDAFCYLLTSCQEAGVQMPMEFNTYAAGRETFFRGLGFASRGLRLEEVNDVTAVPGCREEGILALYRAGILSGTDSYGSFDGKRPLTRAEAAAALARIANPALRQQFVLEPSPYTGYTLTKLYDGTPDFGCYPVIPVEEGLLTIDGTIVDWPGHAFSSGIETSGDYFRLVIVGGNPAEPDNPWSSCVTLMDRHGELVLPLWTYQNAYATSDGHILATLPEQEGGTLLLLNTDGDPVQTLTFPGTPGIDSWWNFNNGLIPRRDDETMLWGYAGADGAWVFPAQWNYAYPFWNGYAVVRSADWRMEGVIDAQGNTVIPCWYSSVTPCYNSPDYTGGVELFRCWGGEDGGVWWVSPDGSRFENTAVSDLEVAYHNGYARWARLSDSAACYLGPDGKQVSEWFDWCCEIDPDGRGFVELNGSIYRIEFHR